MIVSFNWLKQYVPLDMPLAELERRLMMAGLNHEETEEVDGDFAIDLEVTSNRPDCLGHLGVAREISVLWDLELTVPAASPEENGPPVNDLTKVSIECPQLCPRYTARVIQGVNVTDSPAWMRQRLEAIGVTPINNVVDITNYVLLECGQPLHAFDLAKLTGPEIIVREPRRGEKIEAIDHKGYSLEAGMCVIADARRPVAIGGVMGGAQTEISTATTDLLIEAAEFSPASIRGTARKLKLFSDSSYRFERGIDPEGVDWASRRCCELILELAGGTLASGVIDVSPGEPPARKPITLRFGQLKRVLGIDVPPEEARRILLSLGAEQTGGDDSHVEIIPPSWRRDLTREIDLIEEVARIHGYDKIPEDVSVPMAASARGDDDRVLAKIRRALTAAGMNEAMTVSTVNEEWSDAFSPWSDAAPLHTATPVIERANLMRRSLLPSLLAARRTNETLGNERIELFEIANVFLPTAGLPEEVLILSLTGGGDFYAVKGLLEGVLADLNPEARFELAPFSHELVSGRCAQLNLNGETLGFLGEVSPAGAKPFGLRGETTIAELKIERLAQAARLVPQYAKPPDTPAIDHDRNFIVPEQIRWSAIESVVWSNGGELLEAIQYQETYRSQKLAAEGRKKVLFQLRFRSQDRTLTHEEANAADEVIQRAIEKELGGELG